MPDHQEVWVDTGSDRTPSGMYSPLAECLGLGGGCLVCRVFEFRACRFEVSFPLPEPKLHTQIFRGTQVPEVQGFELRMLDCFCADLQNSMGRPVKKYSCPNKQIPRFGLVVDHDS